MTSHLHLRIINTPLVDNKTWRTITLEAMVAILIREQTFNVEADAIRSLRAAGYDIVEVVMCIDDARQAAMQGHRGEGDGKAMSDRKGDKSKQPPECKIEFENHCPNIKETGGGMRGEQYECEVCGERFFLDYEEMR